MLISSFSKCLHFGQRFSDSLATNGAATSSPQSSCNRSIYGLICSKTSCSSTRINISNTISSSIRIPTRNTSRWQCQDISTRIRIRITIIITIRGRGTPTFRIPHF